MAVVEMSVPRRHVFWLTSTFDGCEVEFERQLKKRKAREMKYKNRITPGMGRPRSTHRKRPRKWVFSGNWP
jgi:hypothetical protein